MNILSTKDKFEIYITISFYKQRQKELETEISSSSVECHKNVHTLYHPTAYLIH